MSKKLVNDEDSHVISHPLIGFTLAGFLMLLLTVRTLNIPVLLVVLSFIVINVNVCAFYVVSNLSVPKQMSLKFAVSVLITCIVLSGIFIVASVVWHH